MSDPELLPCPYCEDCQPEDLTAWERWGAYEREGVTKIRVTGRYYRIRCGRCGSAGPAGPTPEEAERLWNHRADAVAGTGEGCGTCDGSGVLDSGGVHPWGEAAMTECPECKAKRETGE